VTERHIFAPTSNNLRVVFAPLAPDADGRRLWLRQWSDSRGEVRASELVVRVGDVGLARRLDRIARAEIGRVARRGSRARYRQELRAARAALKALGWTLTDQEERVMAPLEEYGHRPEPRSPSA
jgi:hypothetical protein